ncbi:MAG: hypothetical protein HQK99_01620 [Nitrospirae bacterium]|nr:hypothetical protein [Nitrospirota bacterium]
MVKSLDTLNIFERLKTAELSDKAAREKAEVFRETIEDRLVTKEDLSVGILELKLELKADIEKTRLALQAEIEKVKVDSIKWMLAFAATQVGIVIAAMGVMFKLFIK